MRIRKDFHSRYQGIGELLEARKEEGEILLTFKEIEKKVGKLPNSAKKFYTWWANNRTPKAPCRHSRVWITKGFVVKKVDFKKGTVLFTKIEKRKKIFSRAEMILKAARVFLSEGKKNFTRKELCIKISHLFPKAQVKIPSLNAAIQAMLLNSNSCKLVGRAWRDTLKNIKRGYFILTEKGLKAKKERNYKGLVLKSDKKEIQEYFEEKYKLNFEKKRIKVSKNTEFPLDYLSEDKNIGIKIYNLRGRFSPQKNFSPSILKGLNILEKSNLKKRIVIFKTKKEGLNFKNVLKSLKPLSKNTNIYLYEKRSKNLPGELKKIH